MGSVDILHGLAFNPDDPCDRHIYATDSLRLRVVRIDVDTGQREVLAEDPLLFNFSVSLQFLPPEDGVPQLVVASDQEYRFAAINPAIPTDEGAGAAAVTPLAARHREDGPGGPDERDQSRGRGAAGGDGLDGGRLDPRAQHRCERRAVAPREVDRQRDEDHDQR